jgi:membrane protease subunit HflK
LVAAVALAAWLGTGVYTVAPSETGVITRFGVVRGKAPPGMHYALPWPIDRVYRPSTGEVRRIEVGIRCLGKMPAEPRRGDMLTGDENILKIMMVVQYKIRDPVAFLFRAEDPHWLVERTVESAMNEYVARLSVDEVLTTAKDEMQIETIRTAQGMMDAYHAGIVLLGGNLQEVSPPVPVVEAFKEVASAKKDSERMLDEAREYEGKVLPKVAGEAQRLISKAEGYRANRIDTAKGDTARFTSLLGEYRKAREVTRTRLLIEALERIFADAKVVILGGNGDARTKITIVEPSKD